MANHWDPFSPRIFPSLDLYRGLPSHVWVRNIAVSWLALSPPHLAWCPWSFPASSSGATRYIQATTPAETIRKRPYFWRFPNPIPPKSCLLIWSGHPKCEWLWGSSSQVWLKTDHVCNTKQFIIAVLPITGSWNRSSFSRFKCHLNPFDSNGSFEVFPIFQADPRYSHYNYSPLHHCVNVNHMSNPFSVRFIGESRSFGGQSIPQNSWQTPQSGIVSRS